MCFAQEQTTLDVELPQKHPSIEPISLHRENYLLFGFDDSDLNNQAVMKFQISAKSRTYWKGLFLAYTQRSYMDLFSSSLPFYDHNFLPEIFYRPTWIASKFLNYMQVGLLHESNGRNGATSRSWNKLYFESELTHQGFYFRPVVWFPFLIETETIDLTKYYGFAEATLGYKTSYMLDVSLRGRAGKDLNTGSLLLNVALPISVFEKNAPESSYAQIWFQTFYGYGETLLGITQKSFAVAAGMGFKPKVKKRKTVHP